MLRCAYAQGTSALRSHLDSIPPQTAISFGVFRETRADRAGQIDLQAACLLGIEIIGDAAGFNQTADVVAASGGVPGVVSYPPDMDLRFLPTQEVGKSNEHIWAKGTLTLTAQTALAAWTEIGLSVASAGVQKMVILNSHGGNVDLISIVGRELRVKAGMFVVKLGWGAFGAPEGVFSAQENSFGIHGGDAETSLVLAFRPETVDMGAARDFRSSAETAPISPIGGVSYGWIASDLNPHGAVGEAHLATAEKGRATAAKMVGDVITLLRKVESHPLEGFAPVPLLY